MKKKNKGYCIKIKKTKRKGFNMSIEEIIELVKDFKKLSYSEEEAKKMEETFIKNFNNEYEIIEKKID